MRKENQIVVSFNETIIIPAVIAINTKTKNLLTMS